MKIKKFSLLKSPFIYKKHWAQYEIRTHSRILPVSLSVCLSITVCVVCWCVCPEFFVDVEPRYPTQYWLGHLDNQGTLIIRIPYTVKFLRGELLQMRRTVGIRGKIFTVASKTL